MGAATPQREQDYLAHAAAIDGICHRSGLAMLIRLSAGLATLRGSKVFLAARSFPGTLVH